MKTKHTPGVANGTCSPLKEIAELKTRRAALEQRLAELADKKRKVTTMKKAMKTNVPQRRWMAPVTARWTPARIFCRNLPELLVKRLTGLVLLLLLAQYVCATAAAAEFPLIRGAPVNLSKSFLGGLQDTKEAEMAISVDPINPCCQVAVTYIPNNRVYAFHTQDGGNNWVAIALPLTVGGLALVNVWDPTVAHDHLGNVFIEYGASVGGSSNLIVVATAAKAAVCGGLPAPPVYQATNISGPLLFSRFDKVLIEVDDSSESPAAGNAYTVYDTDFDLYGHDPSTNRGTFNKLNYFRRLLVGSNAWSNLQRLPDGRGYDLATAPGGEVYMVWHDEDTNGTDRILFMDSGIAAAGCFAGPTNTPPALPISVVATVATNWNRNQSIPAQPDRQIRQIPAVDVDRSHGPHRGRVYVAFHDYDESPGGLGAAGMDVFVAWADGDPVSGIEFRPKQVRKVNLDRTATAQFMPWLDVDDADGSVGVVYYSAQDDPNNQKVHLYYAHSKDGGTNWTNTRLSITSSEASPACEGNDYLDYIGVHLHGGVAYAVWTSFEGGTGCGDNFPDILYNNVAEAVSCDDFLVLRQGISGLPDLSEPGDHFGSGMAVGDFDGDSYPDLAIGAPGETIDGATNAGAVTIIYGGSGGLDTNRTQLITQNLLYAPGESDAGDAFGASLAAGDFDGNGVADLAIGVPDEDLGANKVAAGQVDVVYGARGAGLNLATVQTLTQDIGSIDGTAENHDRFGFSLAAGDFDGDGKDDLAIGVPFEDRITNTLANAGFVNVVYGGAGRLDVNRTDGLSQPAGPAAGPEWGDLFGYSLSVGDFNGGGFADLAIGAPGEDSFSGQVMVVYGKPGGLDLSWFTVLRQGDGAITGNAEPEDQFGYSLAAGDFDGDGKDDLAIGVPFEDINSNTLANAGYVNVVYGGLFGLNVNRASGFAQSYGAIPGAAESGDQFGYSLAVGNFNGDAYDDLAVGVPYEALVGNTVRNAGYVDVIYGGATGLDPAKASSYRTTAQSDALFGFRLVAGDFNSDNHATLAIGYPMSDWSGNADSGAVMVVQCTSQQTCNWLGIVWNNPDGGVWRDPNNWTPNQVPGGTNVAVINRPGTYTVQLDTNATVGGLALGAAVGTQTLTMNRFNLALTGPGTVKAHGVLNLDGGILSGPVEVDGLLQWSGGTLGSAANVTIAPRGLLQVTISGTSPLGAAFLNGALTNFGTVLWTGAGVFGFSGLVHNAPTGVFDVCTNQTIGFATGSSGFFDNAGEVRKSAGDGALVFPSGVSFRNTGAVDVQVGTVAFNGTYSQTGGALNFGITSPTNFGRISFPGIAPLTGALSVNLNNDFVPRTGDAFPLLTYGAPSGVFTSFSLPELVAWQTTLGTSAFSVMVLNSQPTLAFITDRMTDEEAALAFTVVASDPDTGQTLNYALTQAPTGATLDPATGLFSWTPAEAEGPGTYGFNLRVSDSGIPSLSRTQSFTVFVNEVNRPPVLAPIDDRPVDEETTLSFVVVAIDPDFPPNTLTFSLAPDAPLGATIDPATGLFLWTPTEEQGPGTYLITVRVTDDGVPSGSDTRSFAVGVNEVEGAPRLSVTLTSTNSVLISWPAPATGWLLHATTNLTTGGSGWTEISPPYQTNGPNLQVIEPLPTGSMFYRLHKP